MKNRLTIGVIVTMLAATVSFVAAGPYNRVAVTEKLPASDILASMRLLGLSPITRPVRQGPYYVLHAVDSRGTRLRVVVDAELGDILSVTQLYVPRFDAGPRIIHVPQPGERSRADDRDEAALPDDDVGQYAPPPRQRAVRRPVHRSEPRVAPPPRPRRNVLSLPPNPAGLSPIRPTPQISDKLDAKAEAEKFHAPEEQADHSRLPPPGYTPPAAPPAPAKQD